MITRDNFAHLIQTVPPEELSAEIEKHHDYILMEAHFFNVEGYATLKSMDYSAEVETKANINGHLFCSKDDFLRLFEEIKSK